MAVFKASKYLTMSGSITSTQTCGTRYTCQKKDYPTESSIFRTAPLAMNAKSVQVLKLSKNNALTATTVSITLKLRLRLPVSLVTTVKAVQTMPDLLIVKTVRAASPAF